MKEKNCQWYFANHGGRNHGMNDAIAEKFDERPYMSLVRESIQNSLDAVLDPNEPVRVEYSFKYIDRKDYKNFFTLADHIEGCMKKYNYSEKSKAKYLPMLEILTDTSIQYDPTVHYIRISDYNTKGMKYSSDVTEETTTGWYGFVQAVGETIKENEGAGGSFGFGKGAYFLISPISTILVSTMTPEKNTYFSGVSQLCTHYLGDVMKTDVGYYGKDENGNPLCGDEIPERFLRTEPGTDICIMGFDSREEDSAKEEMIESVLRNFWMSIYKKKLVVKVEDVEISRDTIEKLMTDRFGPEDNKCRRMDFPQACNPRPYFEAVLMAGKDNMHREFSGSGSTIGDMHFYVRPSKEKISRRLYMRSLYMMVQGAHEANSYGYYGVFVCDNKEGNELLRSAENSSHTKWVEKKVTRSRGVTRLGSALNEIENFIDKCLEEMFSVGDKKTQDIKDLDKYLRIPTEEDDFREEGSNLEEEGDNISVAEKDPKKLEEKKKKKKEPNIIVTKSTRVRPDEGGSLFSGYRGHKKKIVDDTGGHEGDMSQANREDENGRIGIYAERLVLSASKTYALKDAEGRIAHTIVLVSDKPVDNVRVSFSSANAEGESDTLQVVKTTNGEPGIMTKIKRDNSNAVRTDKNGNVLVDEKYCIRKVHLYAGVNRFDVYFADGMKHTLNITTEEENNENE